MSRSPKTTDVLLCSARNTDGSGASAPSRAARSTGVGRPVRRPPLTPFRGRRPRTTSRRARLTSASTSASARIAVSLRRRMRATTLRGASASRYSARSPSITARGTA